MQILVHLYSQKDLPFAKSILSVLKSGSAPCGELSLPLLPKRREGIVTAARVAYAVAGGTLSETDIEQLARMVMAELAKYLK